MFNVGSVQGYLKLNTTGWSTSMRSATAQVTALSRTFARMGAFVLGTLFLIEREFGKFDKAIRHATSVSETSFAQFKKMSEMALDASVNWNKAAASTAQAFYFLGSAGLTVTEQMQAFNDTIMLSRAMGSELGQTVEGTVDVIRAFGLEFSNIRDIADQLTKTVISSNQQFYTLSRALTYASSTARLTNNTLAETTAMLGVMANAGIKGSMAGTVLRRAMTNLMSPTGGMAGLIHELGINIYDATGQMRPFIDIMGQISDQLQGSTERYKNMVFEVLFGRRAIAGQIVLFNYGSKALKRYADEIQNAGGTTARVAGKQMKAFTEQLGQLWRELQRVSIMIGDTLAPAIERLALAVRMRIAAFREYIKYNKLAIAETLKWAAVIAMASILVPILSLALISVTSGFISLTAAIIKLGIALAVNPLTWLIAALYVLRTTLATDFWKQAFENQIKPFYEGIRDESTQALTRAMWELSLMPRAVQQAFGAKGVLNHITYFVKALQQVGLVARGIAAALHLDWTEVALISDEYAKLTEEMAALPVGSGGRFFMFGSPEEQMADYKGYSNNLKIVGKDIVWMGKKIGMDFGKALTERVSKDAAALGGLVKQIYGKLPFAETTKRIFANLKTMFDIFMTKPYAPFEKLTKDADELQQRLRDTRNSLMDLADAEDKAGEKASILGIEWENALRALFAPEAGNRTWVSMFTDTLKGIEGAWASTIENILNKTFDMAITFENIMESMFLNVLHQFNALVAKIAAQDLLHAMLGGKTERTPGVPSFIGLVKKLFTKTPFTPGLSVPSRGGYGESGLGHLGLQSSPKIAFNIENKGEPVNLRETGRHFDGGQLVINTIMERMDTDPNFRARFGV